ncbi:MAG TPA: flavin reductase family protein [Acidimicrobiales bacterium]|nr:flavin reductase family protein [Acidimicrobiales bacterium]
MSSERPVRSAVDGARFRQVLGHFPTGVTVITAAGPDGPAGLAVGSFFSVSLDPPLVAFCAAKTSSSYPKVEAAGHFVVNVLGDDQEDVCRVFAGKGDKFAGLGYRPSPGSGAPVINDVLAWIDCDIDTVHEAGDHWIVVGHVRELEVGDESGGPLVFYRGGYGRFAP